MTGRIGGGVIAAFSDASTEAAQKCAADLWVSVVGTAGGKHPRE